MSFDGARIVWSEGLFLRPQHFQHQERYLEWVLGTRVGQLQPYGWGFSQLSLDTALLRSGKFGLKSALGLLPDGTPFELPSTAAPLAPLDVPVNARDSVIHLYAMLQRPDAKAVALDADTARARRTRYQAIDAILTDNVVGSEGEAEAQLGQLVLGLCFEADLDGAMSSLPVARLVERKANGELELDPAFIPPLLDALSFERIRDWMVELQGVVKQRGDMLEARLGQAGSKGVADLLLLQLCNRYQPLLAQWCSGSPLHPYWLHQELLKFAGECRTFDAKSRRPPSFPAYRHDNLNKVLWPVIEEIRLAMITVPEQTAIQIPLTDRGQGLFSAEIPDARMVRGGHFVLAVAANLDERRIRELMPGQIRICAPERLVALTQAQSLGIRIANLPGAPQEIRYHANFSYFRLDSASELWKDVEVARQLALFVAGDPPGLELELWFIKA
ncbi:type VI secretion system baseplate subunit TssK [Inhella sp.]|uniref:type VI secretion system baseplate subunit TssK n=1 Tax=Inhella sp. TaxID=1921806 RepID=UPI0035B3F202